MSYVMDKYDFKLILELSVWLVTAGEFIISSSCDWLLQASLLFLLRVIGYCRRDDYLFCVWLGTAGELIIYSACDWILQENWLLPLHLIGY